MVRQASGKRLMIAGLEVPRVCGGLLPDTDGVGAKQGRHPTGPTVFEQRRTCG